MDSGSCILTLSGLLEPLLNLLSLGLSPLFSALNVALGFAGAAPTDFARLLVDLVANFACGFSQGTSI